MRLIFMGTPEFSVPALDALVQSQHEILCVYTQPPRPAGRGKKYRISAVHKYADNLGILVKNPSKLNTKETIDEILEFKPDVIIVVAYGQILPEEILKIPNFGCLNIHASLLPRWRGAAPINRAIMSGDKHTGVSIMNMELGLDTGPIVKKKMVPILPNDTSKSLSEKLANIGSEMLIEVLANFTGENIEQSKSGITYANKIEKSETKIDWSLSANEIDYFIRGLSHSPGAWTIHNGTRLKVLLSEVTNDQGQVGEITKEGVVFCGKNAIRILNIQRPGKAIQDWSSFIRGYNINSFEVLS